jgi:hypothetical protein
MKNVYTHTVNPYGKIIQETIAAARDSHQTRISQRRLGVAVILALLLLFNAMALNAQNCPTTGTTVILTNPNTYYPGTQATVNPGATSITLGAIGAGANFGITPIASGDIVLIIQMQGAQITVPNPATNALYGSNTGNGAGMLAAGLMAGTMEFAIATNGVPVGGGILNITAGLTYSYSYAAFGANGQYTYQVIRVPQYFNIQLGATITTPAWNGSTGGVTVLSAVSQFDMNGKTVDASGMGFRGGGGRQLHGQAGLNKNDFYGLSTNNAHASKGEGVAGTPRYIYFGGALVNTGAEGYPSGSYARGGAGNAGGGGSDSDPNNNDQNSGGAGGGNGGAGGGGGNGWFSFGVTGGRGGTAFRTYAPNTFYYSPSRLIMGGGGGSGTSNDGTGVPGAGVASGGATGGGMIIINSSTIIGTGTLTANGNTGNGTVTIDGSGGGGAGGSILIYANSGHAGVTAIANGGDGGSNNPNSVGGATQHGPGGGGGGGVIYSNNTLNAATTVNQGVSGISIGSGATNNYGASDGFVGVLTQTFPFSQLPPNMQVCQSTVLPVLILSFDASYISSNNVKVAWSTTDEVNASYFEVERSSDNASFIGVAQVTASESLSPVHSYTIDDQLYNISGNTIYYRLRMVDKDGKYTYSKVIALKLGQPENTVAVYPNPVESYTTLSIYSDKPGTGVLRLMDNAGKQLLSRSFTISNGSNSVLVDQLGALPRGIYVIQVMINNNLYNQKIIKR